MPIPITKINAAQSSIKAFLSKAFDKLLAEYGKEEDLLIQYNLTPYGLDFNVIRAKRDDVDCEDILVTDEDRLLAGEFILNDRHEQEVDKVFNKLIEVAPEQRYKLGTFVSKLSTFKITNTPSKNFNFTKSLMEENPKTRWKYIKTDVFDNDFSLWYWDVLKNDYLEKNPSMTKKEFKEQRTLPLSEYFYGAQDFKPMIASLISTALKNNAFSFKETELDEVIGVVSAYKESLSKSNCEKMFSLLVNGQENNDLKIVTAAEKLLGARLENKSLQTLQKMKKDDGLFVKSFEVKERLVYLNDNFFNANLNMMAKSGQKVSQVVISDVNRNSVYRFALNLLKNQNLKAVSGLEDFEILKIKSDNTLCVLSVNENYKEDRFESLLKDGLIFVSDLTKKMPGAEVDPFMGINSSPDGKEAINVWCRKKLLDNALSNGSALDVEQEDNENNDFGMGFKI